VKPFYLSNRSPFKLNLCRYIKVSLGGIRAPTAMRNVPFPCAADVVALVAGALQSFICA
jgi:hypothetical protein